MIPVLIIAFLIRLVGLNQSLWLDEGTTAKVVLNYALVNIPIKFSLLDFHPPFYYLFMKLWTAVFGYSEVSLRMPSVLFSLYTGVFIYLIAKKLLNKKTGLLASALFLFNPLIVYYSQEARMYMMATFFLTASFYFLFVKKNTVLHNLFVFLSFGIFYGSIFFITGMYVYLAYKREWKNLFFCAFGLLTVLTILFPLLVKQLTNARQSLGLIPNWHQVLGEATIKNLFLIPVKFTFGRISFYPKKLYYLLSGAWALVIMSLVFLGGLKNKKIGFITVFPLLLGTIFSIFTPLLQYFRFLYLLPLVCYLMAISVKNRYLSTIILTGFAILSFVYLFNSNIHREDWKALALKLNRREDIYMILPSSDAFIYYLPSRPPRELRSVGKVAPSSRFITVIPYTADIYGFDYAKVLINEGYFLAKKDEVRGLTSELWENK